MTNRGSDLIQVVASLDPLLRQLNRFYKNPFDIGSIRLETSRLFTGTKPFNFLDVYGRATISNGRHWVEMQLNLCTLEQKNNNENNMEKGVTDTADLVLSGSRQREGCPGAACALLVNKLSRPKGRRSIEPRRFVLPCLIYIVGPASCRSCDRHTELFSFFIKTQRDKSMLHSDKTLFSQPAEIPRLVEKKRNDVDEQNGECRNDSLAFWNSHHITLAFS